MKPQIISADSSNGYHNNNLEQSSKRILEGGSWKPQRVIVILPSSATIPTKVALSHWGMVFPPNNAAHRMLALGMEVGEAYSSAISQILADPNLSTWEYILTIEHDNMPPGDGLVRLIEDMEKYPEFSCIGGLYWCKGEAGTPHIWGDPKDASINFRPQVPIPGSVQECCGTSMGFNLWRLEMFKDERLRKPWFKTISGNEGVGTQDLYFWTDARKYNYRCAVDTRILVGHYDYEGKFGPADTVW
jgi:hypothetical protein